MAVLAGCPRSAISRALRDSALVAAETRALIQKLAAEHGYKLNVSARNLRMQRSRMIEVVVEMRPSADRPMSDPYPLELLGGICQELTTVGYSVLLQAQPAATRFPTHAADGIILLGQGPHGDAVRELARNPACRWSSGGPRIRPARLSWSAATIARAAPSPPRGCWRSAAGGWSSWAIPTMPKRRLVTRALLRLWPRPVPPSPPSGRTRSPLAARKRGGAHAAEVRALEPFDGLFAFSDLLAMGAVTALADAGLSVPDTVSVIGCDNTPMGASFVPPLTSIHQDWRQGGILLAKKILQMIEGEPVQSEMLPTQLVVHAAS